MLRIKTKFSESYHVLTLFSLGKWVTISVTNGKPSSTDALNLADAGRNHLISAHKVKIEYECRETLNKSLIDCSLRGDRKIDV
jgi:hypothetical protein